MGGPNNNQNDAARLEKQKALNNKVRGVLPHTTCSKILTIFVYFYLRVTRALCNARILEVHHHDPEHDLFHSGPATGAQMQDCTVCHFATTMLA